MPEMRLLLVGIAATVVVLALVARSARQVLRASLKQLLSAQDRPNRARVPTAKAVPPHKDSTSVRHTPERTRLRWNSPEILAVLLLALAAGLWLARLVK